MARASKEDGGATIAKSWAKTSAYRELVAGGAKHRRLPNFTSTSHPPRTISSSQNLTTIRIRIRTRSLLVTTHASLSKCSISSPGSNSAHCCQDGVQTQP